MIAVLYGSGIRIRDGQTQKLRLLVLLCKIEPFPEEARFDGTNSHTSFSHSQSNPLYG